MSLDSTLHEALTALNQGRYKTVLKVAKSGMKRYKSHPAFPNFAGIALSSQGKHRDAAGYFKKALGLDPTFHDARRNLAQALILLQQSDTALTLLNRLLEGAPKDPDGWYLKGQALLNCGQPRAAADAATRSLELNTRQPRALNLRGVARNMLGDEAEAIADFQTALTLNPNDVEALVNISLPLARQTRHAEALEAAERAVHLAPTHLNARLRLAMQLLESGDQDGARDQFQTILGQAPGHAQAIEQLAALNAAAANADLEPIARRALKTAPRQSSDAARLHFALARMARQAGEQEKFASHLTQANGALAHIMPFDSDGDSQQFESLRTRFNAGADQVQAPAPSGPTPIYVLGLPRSGTTLTETLLGAHPDVCPLGERAVPGVLLAPFLENDIAFDTAACAQFVARDQERLPTLPDGIRFYIDKMPENYRLIGALLTAYPHARIVHMCRDPRDVALSMWQAHFSGKALSYTYDLAAMAHRFNLYTRLMAHWHSVFPGQILDVQYEDLVTDVDGQSRRLADHIGLKWVADMAHPERSTGPVLTLSANQVRQPVHSRSVGSWKPYETMLTPFISGLDPKLWPGVQQG
ncbi:sulfotransferase [Rhodobacteraceae bacterium M382]|nr:sulfotransferase [Rhodobacteraceae bacterium M382]